MESEKYKVLKAFEYKREDGQQFSFEEGAVILAKEILEPSEVPIFVEDGRLELVVEKPEPYTGPMGKYKIIGEAPYTDEDGEPAGFLEIGSIQELPVAVGDQFVEDGLAEKIVESPTSTTNSSTTVPPAPAGIVKKTLEGKEVISDTTRTVNEKKYHHVRLLDGSTQDLTDEEYALKVKTQENE